MRFQRRSEAFSTRPSLAVSALPLSNLTLQEVRIAPFMDVQRYALVENATLPRPVYPDEPAQALLGSIEARRLMLTALESTPVRAPPSASYKTPVLARSQLEMKR